MEDFFDNVEQLSIDEMFSYIEEEFHRGDFHGIILGILFKRRNARIPNMFRSINPK